MADMQPKNTIERINDIRINAMYGKKKHFNAAGRKKKYHDWMGISIIVINMVLASGLMLLLKTENLEWVKWVGAGLSLVACTLAALQKYFSFQRDVTGHTQLGSRYLALMGECTNTLSDFKDELIDSGRLAKKRDELFKSLTKIDQDAQSFPTSPEDYAKSQQGILKGEETYTEQERELRGVDNDS